MINENYERKKAYAVKHRLSDVVARSSSGGAFTALSDWILKQDGVVIGAIFDAKTQKCIHTIVRTAEERNEMRGSKYMWSDLNDVYRKSLPYVENDTWVMFVGTPCQVAGYKAYLGRKNASFDHVLLCDIVCHGTPEPRLWKDYVGYFNKKYGSKIDRINFRDKRNGWTHPSAYAYCGKKEILIADYTDLFYSQCALQKKCYTCKFASLNRPGNITIGDCWGIEKALPDFFDDKGVSLIITHDEQGYRLMDAVRKDLDCKEITLQSCLQPNLKQPTKPSIEREKFLREWEKFGMRFILNKYSKHHLYGKIRHKIKYILDK